MFFSRTAPENDISDASNMQRRPSYHDSSTSSDNSDEETPVKADCAQKKGCCASDSFRVGERSFLIGEQHYMKDKLVFLAHEENPVLASSDLLSTLPVKCGIEHVQFDKLMKYVESLNSIEDGSTSAHSMFASEMLSYYRPKGRLALLSPFLHVSLIIFMCVPTLALFTFW